MEFLLAQRLTHLLARQFDQPKSGDADEIRARAIFSQALAQHVQQGFALLMPVHVDKVDDDDTAHVAQTQLTGDLPRGLTIQGL